VQTARNLTIRLGSLFVFNFKISLQHLVLNCIGKCMFDVCPIVFDLKEKDASSLFASIMLQCKTLWRFQ